jgi:hypothetical protein
MLSYFFFQDEGKSFGMHYKDFFDPIEGQEEDSEREDSNDSSGEDLLDNEPDYSEDGADSIEDPIGAQEKGVR